MADVEQDVIVLSSDDESKPTKTNKQVEKSSEQQKLPLKHTITKTVSNISKQVFPAAKIRNTVSKKVVSVNVNNVSKRENATDVPGASLISQNRVVKNSSPHVQSLTNNASKHTSGRQSCVTEKSANAISQKHLKNVQVYKVANHMFGQTNLRTISSSRELNNKTVSNAISNVNRHCNTSSSNNTPSFIARNLSTHAEVSSQNKAPNLLNGNIVVKPMRSNSINMSLVNSAIKNSTNMEAVPSSVISALQSKGVSVTSVVKGGVDRKSAKLFSILETSPNNVNKVKDSLKRSDLNVITGSENNRVRNSSIINRASMINSVVKSINSVPGNNKRKLEDSNTIYTNKRTKVVATTPKDIQNKILAQKDEISLKTNQKQDFVANSVSSSSSKNNFLKVPHNSNVSQTKSRPSLPFRMSLDSQKRHPSLDTIKQLSNKKGISIQRVNQAQTKSVIQSQNQSLSSNVKNKKDYGKSFSPSVSLNSSISVIPVNNSHKFSLKNNNKLSLSATNHPSPVPQVDGKKSIAPNLKNIDIAKDRKVLMDFLTSPSSDNKKKNISKDVSVGIKKLPVSSTAKSKIAASTILNKKSNLSVSILPINECQSSLSGTSNMIDNSEITILPVNTKSSKASKLSVQNCRASKNMSKEKHLSRKIRSYRLQDAEKMVVKWYKPCVKLERLPLNVSCSEKVFNSCITLSKSSEIDAYSIRKTTKVKELEDLEKTLPYFTNSKSISLEEKNMDTSPINEAAFSDAALIEKKFDSSLKEISVVEQLSENSLSVNISEMTIKKVLHGIISKVEESYLDVSSRKTPVEMIPLKWYDSFHSGENLNNEIPFKEAPCTQISKELQTYSSVISSAIESGKPVGNKNMDLVRNKTSCEEEESKSESLFTSATDERCHAIDVSSNNVSFTSLLAKGNLEKPDCQFITNEKVEEKLPVDNLNSKKIDGLNVKYESSSIISVPNSELGSSKQSELPGEIALSTPKGHETVDRNLDASGQVESNTSHEYSRNDQITSPKLSLKRRKAEVSPENRSLTCDTSHSTENTVKKIKLDLSNTLTASLELSKQTSLLPTEVPSDKEKIEDNRKRFENLLESSKSLMKGTNADEKAKIIKNMHRQLKSTESSYIKSREFSELLDTSLSRLRNKENVFIILIEMKQKLKNNKCKNKAFHPLENDDDSNAVTPHIHCEDSSNERKRANYSPIPSASCDNILVSEISHLEEAAGDNSVDFQKISKNVCAETQKTNYSSMHNKTKTNDFSSNNEDFSVPSVKNCNANEKMNPLCIDVTLSPASDGENNLEKESPSLLSLLTENISMTHCKNYHSTPPVASTSREDNFSKIGNLPSNCSAPQMNDTTSKLLKKDNRELNFDITSMPSTSKQDSPAERLHAMPQESKPLTMSGEYVHSKEKLLEDQCFLKFSKSVTKSKIDDAILLLKEASKSRPRAPSTELEAPENISDPKTAARIKILEKHCRKIEKKIRKLENQELSLDDLEAENSAYLEEDRYKRRYMKIYKMLCKLRNLPSRTGRAVEKKFVLEESRYKEINEAVQNLINQRKVNDKFPDFQEIHGTIQDLSADIGLDERTVDLEAQRMFTEVGLKLKRRRLKDHNEVLDCYLPDGVNQLEDPAERDPDLLKKIMENGERFQKSTQDILDKYVRMQEEAKEGNPEKEGCCNEENDDLSSTDKEPSESKDENCNSPVCGESDSDCAVIEVVNGSDGKSTDPNSDDCAAKKCSTNSSTVHEQNQFLSFQEPTFISDDVVIESDSSNDLPDIRNILNV